MKVALYARYSSDNQREASIADQIRLCRVFAEREGWSVAGEFHDHAISGATLLRPGFQALMRRALDREFDIVLAESLEGLFGFGQVDLQRHAALRVGQTGRCRNETDFPAHGLNDQDGVGRP